MKRITSLTVALLITVVLVVPVLAGEPDPGTGKTNFTVMNLDDSATASVQADYVSAMSAN